MEDISRTTKRNFAIYMYRQRKAYRLKRRFDDSDVIFKTTDNGVVIPIQIQNRRMAEGFTPRIGETKNSRKFKNTFHEARNKIGIDRRWRVDDSYTEADYDHAKKFMCDGATYAIKPSGDIVSVCVPKDCSLKGKQILESAVQNGGDRLDAYEGIYGFYVKCGFEPVSWCKWNDDYAPDDWKKANGLTGDSWKGKELNLDVKREDIIFYKYTGKRHTESVDEFKQRVQASNDYDEAQVKRDNSIKG